MFAASLLVAVTATVPASAQVVDVPATPQIGSSNPITAEPAVMRPGTKPCIVTLFSNQPFADFNPKNFSYTPPASCHGPWSKVVLSADFTVTEGRQFDRTAEFFLGNVSLLYGTTAEPRRALSPSWHVERDVTDLSALFESPQTGAANIGNVVDSTYTGIIYATATLEFYPASSKYPASAVPDMVAGLNTGNSAATLNSTSSSLTKSVLLPRNLERVYLDVIAQSQSNDEFWYLCVPTADAAALESCGSTAFRETEVTIDGTPAGVAPVYPWIYTGGLDPYLWEPITGIQTLDFKPYRVDLTPFAGLLADGNRHVLGVSVYNADGYFLMAATFLGYRDQGAAQVTGGVLSNSLTIPSPVVTSNLKTNSVGTTTGTVSVAAERSFKIHGFVNTSKGRVDTTVEQRIGFVNTQQEDVNPNLGPDDQDLQQLTIVDSWTSTQTGGSTTVRESHLAYPLDLNYAFLNNSDGTYTQNVAVEQDYEWAEGEAVNGVPTYGQLVAQRVHSQDSLPFDASFNITAPGTGSSTGAYYSWASDTGCFSRTLQAAGQVLTSVVNQEYCQ